MVVVAGCPFFKELADGDPVSLTVNEEGTYQYKDATDRVHTMRSYRFKEIFDKTRTVHEAGYDENQRAAQRNQEDLKRIRGY